MSDTSEPEYEPSIWERSPLVQFFLGTPPESGGRIPDYAIGDGIQRGIAAHTCRRLESTPDWPGPAYPRPLRRLRDVSDLLGALAAIARAGRPLAPGLEAMLWEEMRGRFAHRCANAWLLAGLGIAAGVCFAVSAWLFVELVDEEYALVPAYVGSLFVILLVVLHLRRARDNPRLEAMVALHRHLVFGDALSLAMKRLRRVFPQDYIALVEAGERSGRLGDTLTELEQETLRRLGQTRSAGWTGAYLVGVLVGCVGLGAFCLLLVVPVLREIIEEFGLAVPPRALVPGLFPGLNDADVLVFSTVVCCAFILLALLRLRRAQSGKAGWAPAAWIPWASRSTRLQDLQLGARLIARELEAGLPLPDTMEHAASAATLPRVRRAWERAAERMRQGESLCDAIAAQPRAFDVAAFPRYVELGERSGRLPEALRQAADLYEARLRIRSEASETLLRCAAVLVVGALALVLVQSMYSMLMDVTHGAINQI